MKIAYFSNVLGLRDISDLQVSAGVEDDFNNSLIELLADFQNQGATMTICFLNDNGSIEWVDIEHGVEVGRDLFPRADVPRGREEHGTPAARESCLKVPHVSGHFW